MEFTLWLQLYSSGLGMNGVGAHWQTDHMFGVSSRVVSKYALREPELEKEGLYCSITWQKEGSEKEWCVLLINQLNKFGKSFTSPVFWWKQKGLSAVKQYNATLLINFWKASLLDASLWFAPFVRRCRDNTCSAYVVCLITSILQWVFAKQVSHTTYSNTGTGMLLRTPSLMLLRSKCTQTVSQRKKKMHPRTSLLHGEVIM